MPDETDLMPQDSSHDKDQTSSPETTEANSKDSSISPPSSTLRPIPNQQQKSPPLAKPYSDLP